MGNTGAEARLSRPSTVMLPLRYRAENAGVPLHRRRAVGLFYPLSARQSLVSRLVHVFYGILTCLSNLLPPLRQLEVLQITHDGKDAQQGGKPSRQPSQTAVGRTTMLGRVNTGVPIDHGHGMN